MFFEFHKLWRKNKNKPSQQLCLLIPYKLPKLISTNKARTNQKFSKIWEPVFVCHFERTFTSIRIDKTPWISSQHFARHLSSSSQTPQSKDPAWIVSEARPIPSNNPMGVQLVLDKLSLFHIVLEWRRRQSELSGKVHVMNSCHFQRSFKDLGFLHGFGAREASVVFL